MGALVAPATPFASEPNTLIHARYPTATLTKIYEDPKNKTWVYQVSSTNEETVLAAYGFAKSRSGYYPILLTSTLAGKVLNVELPDYPHKFGWQAAKPLFLQQYQDKTAEKINFGQTIHAVTGATVTAKTTAEKVRELLKLMQQLPN